jgi:transposase
LKAVNQQIKSLDTQIAKLIDADDHFKHTDQLLRTVPGVGKTLSATLLADFNELGKTDKRKVTALAGLAPFNNDSGTLNGQRSIRGGREQVRNVLYMASLAAITYNPVIAAFAQRLKAKGKKSKVVIVACMRKLLTLLNAMVRENLTWNQLHVTKIA